MKSLKRRVYQIYLGSRQYMYSTEGNFADRSKLLHQPGWIVPALLHNSDQPQGIQGTEWMAGGLAVIAHVPIWAVTRRAAAGRPGG